MKAGLFDRAEEAFRALMGTPFDTEARLALLSLFERSRDWRAATDVAAALEKAGTGSFSQRMAHYQCELALEADAAQTALPLTALLARAPGRGPAGGPAAAACVRSACRARATHAAALQCGTGLRLRNPEAFGRVAGEYAACAQAAGPNGRRACRRWTRYVPPVRRASTCCAHSLRSKAPPAGASPRLLDLLRTQPSLSAALELLDTPRADMAGQTARQSVRDAVSRAARPLQRYRCAACGFEAQRHFWQCPGCLGWDTFPPQRIEEPRACCSTDCAPLGQSPDSHGASTVDTPP
jgi:lipopolysaccharide biosynthesis regulator YciM